MAKRKTKPKAKTKRPRAPRPRTWLKDERGVPLTDNRRPFSLLPSDLLPAMGQPPGTPTKATHEIRGDRPTTAIPELKAIEFTEFAFQSVNEAIKAADQVQIERMNPTGRSQSQV